MENIRQGLWRWPASMFLAIVIFFNAGAHIIEHVHYELKPAHLKVVATKTPENKIIKKATVSTAILVNKPIIVFKFQPQRVEPVYLPVSYRIWFYSKIYQSDYLVLSPLVNKVNYQREREGINSVWNNRYTVF